MANRMRMVYDNAVSRGTLTSSSAVLPVENLSTFDKSTVWRNNLPSGAINLALSTAESVSCVSLPFCNLSPTATMRFRATNEVATSNLFASTEQLETAAYTKSGSAVGSVFIIAPDGTSSARPFNEDVANSSHYIQRNASLTTGIQYTFSMFVKAGGRTRCRLENSTLGAFAQFNLSTGTILSQGGAGLNAATIEAIASSPGWFRVSITYTPTSTGSFAHTLYILDNASAMTYAGSGSTFMIYPWGWQLEIGPIATSYYPSTQTFTSRGSPGTYIDVNGLVATASSGVARMTYQYPSLGTVAPRLLVEAAATNYFTYSHELDNAIWVKSSSGTGVVPVVTANYAVAPDGTLSADRLVCVNQNSTSVNNYSAIARNGTVGAVSNYCASIWMKSNTGANQEVLMYGASAGIVAIVTPEWQRFFITSYSGTSTWPFVFGTRGGSGSYINGGQAEIDISVWGAQVESGVVPTSYIPTVASTVVRSADVYTSAAATRPSGYMDWWQSYACDSGVIVATGGTARRVLGLTAAQSSSAYGYGGGLAASVYITPTSALNVRIDISDPLNPQGYLEAPSLIVGQYFSPTYDAEMGAEITSNDTSRTVRSDSGNLVVDVGTRSKSMSFDMSVMTHDDRKTMWKIVSYLGTAYPVFVSLFPENANKDLEQDYTIYGCFSKLSGFNSKASGVFGTSLEIESV